MTKKQASRLKRGQEVMVYEKCEVEGRTALVIFATIDGGVKVLIGGEEQWYPYNRVCGGALNAG